MQIHVFLILNLFSFYYAAKQIFFEPIHDMETFSVSYCLWHCFPGLNLVPAAVLSRETGIAGWVCQAACENTCAARFDCCCHYTPGPSSLPGRDPGTGTTTPPWLMPAHCLRLGLNSMFLGRPLYPIFCFFSHSFSKCLMGANYVSGALLEAGAHC